MFIMKNLKITVNGVVYDVQVEEADGSVQTTAAAAPKAILDVPVKAGQSVKSGDVLVVLEAMKMENEIKAGRDATVASVEVSKGESVDTGAVLVTLN